MSEVQEDGRIYMFPAFSNDVYFLRLAVVVERTTPDDKRYSFEAIKACADRVLINVGDVDGDGPVVVDIDLPRKKTTAHDTHSHS